MQRAIKLLFSTLVVCSGFSTGALRSAVWRRSHTIAQLVVPPLPSDGAASDGVASPKAASPKVAVASEAADLLWQGAGKPLLRIGKSGAGATHANGLADLCVAHPYVCVRLTGAGTSAALDHLIEIIEEEAAVNDAKRLTLLATRKPRKGGVEALFSRSSLADEVCSPEYHSALQSEAERAQQQEMADAVTYKESREAKAARQALKADKFQSKMGKPRRHRAAGSAPRASAASMMAASKFNSVDELEAAIREHIASLPEGSVDDKTLPSPLNYKELSYHGRDDLVQGCMAFGGYLQLSNAMGLPVRIGVERDASDVKSGGKDAVAEQGTKVFNLFNMFGKSG